MRPIPKLLLVMALVLGLIAGSASVATMASVKDVPSTDPAYKVIMNLISKGYIKADDGFFKGNQAVDRYTFAVALGKLLNEISAGSVLPSEEDATSIRKLSVEFRDDLVLVNNKLGIFDERIKQLEKSNVAIRTDIGQLTEENGRQTSESARIRQDIDRIIIDIASIKQDITEIKSELDSTKQELVEVKDSMGLTSNTLTSDIAARKDEIAQLRALLDQISARIEELEKEDDLLTQKNAELTQKDTELSQSIANLTQKDTELSQSIANLTQKDTELGQNIEGLSANLTQKNTELGQRIDSLDLKLDDSMKTFGIKFDESLKAFDSRFLSLEQDMAKKLEEAKKELEQIAYGNINGQSSLQQQITMLSQKIADLENQTNSEVEKLRRENSSIRMTGWVALIAAIAAIVSNK